MSTQLDHSLEPFDEVAHTGILYAAALEGIDISPMVGQAQRFIGYGATKEGYGPACIVDLAGTDYCAEPHVTWFPWTTPTNRIANFKWAMEYLSKDKQVLLTVQKSEIKFFEFFVRKKILRKVGYLKDLPLVEEIHMYQYERSSNE